MFIIPSHQYSKPEFARILRCTEISRRWFSLTLTIYSNVGEQNCFMVKQTNLSKVAVEIGRQQAAQAVFWE
jgi:hypothetical protein